VFVFGLADFAPTLLILRATDLLTPVHGIAHAAQLAALLYALRNALYAGAAFPVGSDYQFSTVQIDTGVDPHFDNQPGTIIRVSGSWLNNSSTTGLTAKVNTVYFNNPSSIQTVDGTQPTTFQNVVIDGAGISLIVNQSVDNSGAMSAR
jgi:hypothetical protein